MIKYLILIMSILTSCTINVNVIDTQKVGDSSIVKTTSSFGVKTDFSQIPKYFSNLFKGEGDTVVVTMNGEEHHFIKQ